MRRRWVLRVVVGLLGAYALLLASLGALVAAALHQAGYGSSSADQIAQVLGSGSPDPVTRDGIRPAVPCRVTALLGPRAGVSLRQMDGVRAVDVVVYDVPDPEAGLQRVATGLSACGTAPGRETDATTSQLLRYGDVRSDGRSVRWSAHTLVQVDDTESVVGGGAAELRSAGACLVYVAVQRAPLPVGIDVQRNRDEVKRLADVAAALVQARDPGDCGG